MINSIIEGISVALDAEFGYEIHMEEIKQGLQEPCFFISCLNPTMRPVFGKRYHRENRFCIQYFPESDESRRECNDVGERLNCCLEYITVVGNLCRGTKMNYEVVDGVLNFFVNYDCFVYKTEQQMPMESLQASTSVKEGG